jgi:hypothetical protein
VAGEAKVRSVDQDIEEKIHFPFVILDLILVIAGGDPDSMPNFHWENSGQ